MRDAKWCPSLLYGFLLSSPSLARILYIMYILQIVVLFAKKFSKCFVSLSKRCTFAVANEAFLCLWYG